MGGHVFQLAAEGAKGNQFTTTLEALSQYATIAYDHAKDLAPLFKSPSSNPIFLEPPDQPPMLVDGVTRADRDHRKYISWKRECETYDARVEALKQNQHKLFAVVLLQCSPNVKSKLENTSGYNIAKEDSDCCWLLDTLRNICHRFEDDQNRFVALIAAKKAVLNYRQSATQSVVDYFEVFKELISVLESYGGKLHDPEASAAGGSGVTKLKAEERDAYMRNYYCGILFILNADDGRFGSLKTELAHDFGKKRDEYPPNLVEARKMLTSRSPPSLTDTPPPTSRRRNRHNRGSGRGSHSGRSESGRGGGSTSRAPTQSTQVGLNLAQIDNHFPDGIPNHLVLLDSDSTVSIFCNADLLTDIHKVDESLLLVTNGGSQVSHHMGMLPDFGPVWYNPDSIANVLSLAQVRSLRRVTMDSAVSPAFHVHKLDGTGITVFSEHPSGLYLYDTTSPPSPLSRIFLSPNCC